MRVTISSMRSNSVSSDLDILDASSLRPARGVLLFVTFELARVVSQNPISAATSN